MNYTYARARQSKRRANKPGFGNDGKPVSNIIVHSGMTTAGLPSAGERAARKDAAWARRKLRKKLLTPGQ